MTGLERYVLGLGRSNDEQGHGLTLLKFEALSLLVRPGENEDYIVVELGAAPDLSPEYWTRIEAGQVSAWSQFLGAKLESIDLYSDGREDVALLFHFGNNQNFSIVLCDTDLSMATALEPFEAAQEPVALRLRERIGEDCAPPTTRA